MASTTSTDEQQQTTPPLSVPLFWFGISSQTATDFVLAADELIGSHLSFNHSRIY